jgi:hypothetical protein
VISAKKPLANSPSGEVPETSTDAAFTFIFPAFPCPKISVLINAPLFIESELAVMLISPV